MSAENLQQLLIEELQDLYDAEKQLIKALPKMAAAASNEQLSKGINEHLEQTKKQAERLEKAFEILGEKARSRPCQAMKGLITEADEHVSETSDEELVNTVVIGGGRRIEHYEIAAYSGAIELAEVTGNDRVAKLLGKTLVEEERTERKLRQLSSRLLKQTLKEAA